LATQQSSGSGQKNVFSNMINSFVFKLPLLGGIAVDSAIKVTDAD